VPHPVTGLTKHDIENVRRAWETIRTDRAAIVSIVFIKCHSLLCLLSYSTDATLLS
jgi:hypothetical protein